jgi:hypothetical protein
MAVPAFRLVSVFLCHLIDLYPSITLFTFSKRYETASCRWMSVVGTPNAPLWQVQGRRSHLCAEIAIEHVCIVLSQGPNADAQRHQLVDIRDSRKVCEDHRWRVVDCTGPQLAVDRGESFIPLILLKRFR